MQAPAQVPEPTWSCCSQQETTQSIPAGPWGLPASPGAPAPALPPKALPGEPRVGASVRKPEVPRDATAHREPWGPWWKPSVSPKGEPVFAARQSVGNVFPLQKVET